MEIAAGLSPFFSFLVKNVKYIILALIFNILYDLKACILVKR